MHEQRIEKHLYERKHQMATGEWSRSYYIRLKDWKGIRRVWPAGNTLKTAKAKRAEYEHRNALREDFDLAKVKGMTFTTWTDIYLKKHAVKKKSLAEDQRMVGVLREFSGSMLLSQITRTTVEEFKQLRKNRQTWRGDPVSDAYCNRELGCLRHILKLAVEEGMIEASPLVKLYKENNARDRALTEEEYQ